MPTRLRALCVGCGAISGEWLKAAAAMDDVQVVGLADVRPEAAEARRSEFDLQDSVSGGDYRSMLATLRPDVVFNCTTPEAHRAVTLDALSAGCHVLTEKPLATSLEEAKELIEAARKKKRLLTVIQNNRYNDPIRKMRSFLASRAIGEITTAACDFFIGAHWYGGFREQMRHVLLLDMAIHTFDQARFLTGTDPLSVYCHEWNPPGSWYERDASAVAVFEMSRNITFVYRGSWCSEGCNTSWMANWRFAGTRGSALWDGADEYRAEVVLETAEVVGARDQVPKPQKTATPLPINETKTDPLAFTGHAGVMREFLDCIRSGGTPLTEASDNIKSLSMVFAAIESAETGRKVGIST